MRWGSGEGIFNYHAKQSSWMWHFMPINWRVNSRPISSFPDQAGGFVPAGNNSSFWSSITCRITMNSGHCGRIKIMNFGKSRQVSRDYLKTTVHPQTGSPNFSYFDGNLTTMTIMATFVMMPFVWAQM
jgi:hypothetical protein